MSEPRPLSSVFVIEQTAIDAETDPIRRRVAEAQALLAALNFDSARCNERSALTLLALLALRPEDPWASAGQPLLRTVDIMSWLGDHYDKHYKPNSRETIRRGTLHQFIEAALVALNPDDPSRPTNSGGNCYQIDPSAFDLVAGYQKDGFGEQLSAYLARVPGLRAIYAAERDLARIPVTLLDGSSVTLSPGGQNVLIKQILDEFCPRYTPGGRVLYLGDADAKMGVFEEDELATLGVTINSHGKMPDLVVHLPDRDWLVLIEAASSHGPVDAKRHGELKTLFKDSTAGLVFISCLPSREVLRRYLKDIAWETDVWCADNVTHLIHFNGVRFLGPYRTHAAV
jgi:type II restriction enzyme